MSSFQTDVKRKNMRQIPILYSRFLVLLIGLIGLLPNVSLATHIVGGELTYECLGNDQYEVSLTVFRDCFLGNPNAYFDNPASIGVFNSNGFLLNELQIAFTGQDDTLNPVLFDPCLVIPPDVCIHTTVYKGTISLPFQAGGYQLSYQRCCRNQTIQNIINPLATGATYYSFVSEDALLGCNSSPEFIAWPPPYICSNQPILFDHSAIDPDGDSLVYSLCDPFFGADQNIPRPQPPNPPPYGAVTWNPPYSNANMLGGPLPLTIDSQTGFLTGTPMTTGQFVVGICVEEYRNGILISTTKRDFQYNIGVCGLEVVSAFLTPDVECGGLAVNFINESEGSTTYSWNFGDPNNPNAGSTAQNPSYTYPGVGTYDVYLVVGDSDGCRDSITEQVTLVDVALEADFDFQFSGCEDQITLLMNDLSSSNTTPINSWNWSVSSGEISTQQNPTFMVPTDGSYQIELMISNGDGCEEMFTQSVNFQQPEINLEDMVILCDGSGGSVNLNPSGNSNFTYAWSPSNTLNSGTSPNPTASPLTTTTYSVTVTSSTLPDCVVTDEVEVFVPEPVAANFDVQYDGCEETINFNFTDQSTVQADITNWNWNFGDGQTSTEASPSVDLATNADYTITLIVTTQYGCQDTTSQFIPLQLPQINLEDTTVTCDWTPVELNIDGNPEFNYTWTPTATLDDPNATTPIASPLVTTSYYVTVTSDDLPNCILRDSITVILPEIITIDATEDTSACSINLLLSSSSNVGITYEWATDPDFNNIISNTTDVLVSPDTTETFYVRSIDQYGCEVRDTVDATSFAVNIDTENLVLLCQGDTTRLSVINTDIRDTLTFTWTPLSEIDADETTGTPLVSPDQPFNYYVTVENQHGCIDEDSIFVDVSSEPPFIEAFTEKDSIFPGQTTQLSSTIDEDYIYSWSPSAVLNAANISNPVATLIEQGEVFVVTVRDEYGCTNQDSVQVLLRQFFCDEPYIFVPNAFTPNGDGENDILYVRANSITEVNMIIYNRWGEKMFETNDLDNGWDGTYNGKELPPDVFGLYLYIRCLNGEEYVKKSNVTILR